MYQLTHGSVFFLLTLKNLSAQRNLTRNRTNPWWPEGSMACLEQDGGREVGWGSQAVEG